jgi:hypothetical protein
LTGIRTHNSSVLVFLGTRDNRGIISCNVDDFSLQFISKCTLLAYSTLVLAVLQSENRSVVSLQSSVSLLRSSRKLIPCCSTYNLTILWPTLELQRNAPSEDFELDPSRLLSPSCFGSSEEFFRWTTTAERWAILFWSPGTQLPIQYWPHCVRQSYSRSDPMPYAGCCAAQWSSRRHYSNIT